MDVNAYSTNVGRFRTQKHKLLNDTYIWVKLSLSSFQNSLQDFDFLKQDRFEVPTKGSRLKEVRRDKKQVVDILENAKSELLNSVFVYIVAQFEGFLSDLIRETLRFDNRRLRTNVNGINHFTKIELKDIIELEDKNKIIDFVVEKELISIFYASPTKQREYTERVTGVEINADLWENWLEYKATRDLIVHSNGIINDVYLSKAGQKKRGELGDQIKVDLVYFENSIADIKSMIGSMISEIQRKANKPSAEQDNK